MPDRYIKGTITGGSLEGVPISIGPLRGEIPPTCDTMFATSLCRPVPVRFEGSEFETIPFEILPKR